MLEGSGPLDAWERYKVHGGHHITKGMVCDRLLGADVPAKAMWGYGMDGWMDG